MIYGVDYIFIIPPIIVLAIALFMFIFKIAEGNYKQAFINLIRIVVYGGGILFLMFLFWMAVYYSGGGH